MRARRSDSYVALTPSLGDVGIPSLSVEEIVRTCEKFDLASTFERVSHLAVVLSRGGADSRDFGSFLIRTLIRPSYLSKFSAFERRRSQSVIVPFHEGMFRLLLKFIWRYSSANGGKVINSDEDWFELGDILLSFDEAFPAPAESERVQSPLTSLEYALLFNQHGYRNKDELEFVYPTKEGVLKRLLCRQDISEAFLAHTGFTPAQLHAGFVTMLAYFGQMDSELAKKQATLTGDLRYLFGAAGVSKNVGDWILRNHVATLAEGPRGRMDRYQESVDFGYLLDKPYVEIEANRVLCCDWEYAEALISRGVYKVLSDALKGTRINLEHRQGDAFEDYAAEIIKGIADKRKNRGAKTIGPFTETKKELDAGYQENGCLVVVECKSGPAPTTGVMTLDPSVLAKHLDEKYIFGTSEKSGAVIQLAKRLKRILENPKQYGVKASVAKVIPVIVVEDRFLAGKLVQKYIRDRGTPLLSGLPKKVCPIIVLHVSDLARIKRFADQIGMADAIQRWMADGYPGYDFQSWFERSMLEAGLVGSSLDNSYELLSEAGTLLHSGFVDHPFLICPHCGSAREFHPMNSPFWHCSTCSEGNCPAEQDDLSHFEAMVRDMIRRYNEGGWINDPGQVQA